MTLTVELSHIITAVALLFTGFGVAANWLLRDQRQEIKAQREDMKRLREIDLPGLLREAKADYMERIAKTGAECGERLSTSVARQEERHQHLVEKTHENTKRLDQSIVDIRTDHGSRLRNAERILGRYEVLNSGRPQGEG